VKCAACGTANQDAAKFCLECGKPLKGTAAAAAQDDPLRRYIPSELLAKLEAARKGGGMLGERRIVTMLFCDVKGSTAAAGRLDPEEWADIMNGAFAHLIAPVYRYEGTLARLMGDAILAFFGAPVAHEDDPQRAVLAALAIVREIAPYRQQVKRQFDIDFDVRVGINTGLVVVGEVGSDLRLEYTAMGDAVNLAARMEQTADPGTVRVSEATYKPIAPLFDAEDQGPIDVKGKDEPVRVYRIVGPKARPGRLRGVEGLASPMIGRDRELAALHGLARAAAGGRGHVVSLMAEAGLGKSRLVAELRAALAADGTLAGMSVHEGRTLSYQTSVPYAPVADLIRHVLGLSDRAAPGYADLQGALARVLDESGRDAVAPFIASALGIALPAAGAAADRVRFLEPPALQTAIVGAVADLVSQLAARRPLLLVLEDLHWADTSSLQVIERLLAVTDRASLMLLLVLRPRRDEPSWRLHEVAARDHAARYTPLTLEPLGDDDTRALVANLLRVEGLTDSVRGVILSKAEGNPYFVEEVIRSLIDQGVVVRDGEDWKATRDIEGVAIPGSLSAVLSARLDRLDDATRRVAQMAAVIGREVDLQVLKEVLGADPEMALAELQQRGLVRERNEHGRRTYWFKHVLVQETAYGSLLLKSRREIHRQVADVLARLDPERAADIARHYLEARDEARALPFLVTAAERAARAYSTPEALRLYDRAIAILGGTETADAALATRAFEGRGAARMLTMDIPGTMQNWQEMIAWATVHAQEPMRVSALNKLAMIHGLMLGDDAHSRRLLDEAESAAEGAGCQPGLAEGCMVRCALHLGRAEFDTAYRYLDRASELGRALQAEEPLLFGMTHITNTLLFMTEYDRVLPQAEATLAKARELGNKKYEAEIQGYALPLYQLRQGDVSGANASLREAVRITEHIGAAGDLAMALVQQSKLARVEGRREEAVALAERAAAVARGTGLPYIVSFALASLAGALADVKATPRERVLALSDEALETMKMPSGTFFGGDAFAELGFAALAVGDVVRAQTMFERGLTEPNATMRLARPRLLAGAAEVALADGRLTDARAHAAEARAMVEERQMRHERAAVARIESQIAAAT
jgi:class 3 adenylate cyclase/tetratricopeptide (TPR) repeat protein